MLQDLGLKSTGATSIVKRYMNPTKLYKQQYEFYFADEFKGNITGFLFMLVFFLTILLPGLMARMARTTEYGCLRKWC